MKSTWTSAIVNTYLPIRWFLRGKKGSVVTRNTWSNRQIGLWNTEWSRAKANRVLPRERTGHSKHPLPTTQEKTLHIDIARWPTPKSDWLYYFQPKMEKLYIVSKKQDQELTVAQTMNSLLPNSDLNWRKWVKSLDHSGIIVRPGRSTSWNQEIPGWNPARRNINNLRYADDTTLMAESEGELKSLLMNVKRENEKVGLKFNIQKTKV